jgi:hypothetical protein
MEEEDIVAYDSNTSLCPIGSLATEKMIIFGARSKKSTFVVISK